MPPNLPLPPPLPHTVYTVLVLLVEVLVGVPAHSWLCRVVVNSDGGVVPRGVSCGRPGGKEQKGSLQHQAQAQARLLPLIFSGLEEKMNSTEAWKGNLSSVRSGQ